ncbi:DUF6544 family protein [Dyadobacter sp. Leaf189]|uniref:DUF6544 family protein n=1 Tax=Dyadobacter sp. Leaf189 TaxID=1736295 RepID=UPI0038D393E7
MTHNRQASLNQLFNRHHENHIMMFKLIAAIAIEILTPSLLVALAGLITWLTVQSNSVNASFTNGDLTISAWLQFNEEGLLLKSSLFQRTVILRMLLLNGMSLHLPQRSRKTPACWKYNLRQ